MTYEHILVEHDGAVDWLTLNRPDQLNTLNPGLLGELNDYFVSLERHYSVRVVVMKGAGRMSVPAWTSRPRVRHSTTAPTP